MLLSTENPRPQSEKEMSYITAFDVTNIESDFNQVNILLSTMYVRVHQIFLDFKVPILEYQGT